MSVDAVPGGSIDTTRTVTGEDPFDVSIDITAAGIGYQAYQAFLSWDDARVTYADPPGVTYTGLGGMALDAAPVPIDADTDTVTDGVQLGSGGSCGAGATGQAAVVRLACVTEGTTLLHLVTLVEDPAFGSTTLGVGGVTVRTSLEDATITCSLPPTPTPCPAEVCTPTPTPTATTTPTPTGTPNSVPNRMVVDALSGGDINSTLGVLVGTQVDVDLDIQHGGDVSENYAGYQAYLGYSDAILAFVPSWEYTGLGGMSLDSPTVEVDVDGDTLTDGVQGGSSSGCGWTNASGPAIRASFFCAAEGTTTLHLVTLDEDPSFGTTTMGSGGVTVLTGLTDAAVTCLNPNTDYDADGCTNAEDLMLGYNPLAWHDFYDVPVPARLDPDANGPKNGAVTMGDVLAVLFYVGTSDNQPPNPNGVDYDSDKDGDTVEDGRDYDRSDSPFPNPPWDAGIPNGAVSMVDVLAVLAQVGLDCTGLP
jgi:hypothetical protein